MWEKGMWRTALSGEGNISEGVIFNRTMTD